MTKLVEFFPDLEPEEFMLLERITEQMDAEQLRNFASIYRARRRDPQTVLLLAALGFLGFAGIHRFYLNSIGFGILYILTYGLCLIGTIVDIVNYKSMTYEYNENVAMQAAQMV